jgi:ferredoxin
VAAFRVDEIMGESESTIRLGKLATEAVKRAQLTNKGESLDQAAERLILTSRDAYQREGEMKVVTKEGKKVGVRIDQDLCTAYQSCEYALPEVFKLVSLRRGEAPLGMMGVEPGKVDMESLKRAAESCPNKAIILKDLATGEQIFP